MQRNMESHQLQKPELHQTGKEHFDPEINKKLQLPLPKKAKVGPVKKL